MHVCTCECTYITCIIYIQGQFMDQTSTCQVMTAKCCDSLPWMTPLHVTRFYIHAFSLRPQSPPGVTMYHEKGVSSTYRFYRLAAAFGIQQTSQLLPNCRDFEITINIPTIINLASIPEEFCGKTPCWSLKHPPSLIIILVATWL